MKMLPKAREGGHQKVFRDTCRDTGKLLLTRWPSSEPRSPKYTCTGCLLAKWVESTCAVALRSTANGTADEFALPVLAASFRVGLIASGFWRLVARVSPRQKSHKILPRCLQQWTQAMW